MIVWWVGNMTLLTESQNFRHAELAYPSWFWQMPKDSLATFAVGYARRYVRLEASFAHARQQSFWQLVYSQKVAVKTDQELFNRSGQNRLIRFTESQRLDSTLAAMIAPDFSILDSAVVGDIVLALAVFPQRDYRNIYWRSPPASARPRWVDTLPDETVAIYAIGTSPLYYYEHHSWERAEANARYQLALAVLTHLESITWRTERSFQMWSQSESSMILRHAVVVSRWLDTANRQCYVLCRMPLQ